MVFALCRRLAAFLGLLVVGAVLVSGCESSADEVLLGWSDFDAEFNLPAQQAWRNSLSSTTASFTPHHAGYDLFLRKGQRAPIEGKFHYGDVYKDLEDEWVGCWVRQAGGFGWTHIGDTLTDSNGEAGWAFPADLLTKPGHYFCKFVVYGDLTTCDSLIRIIDKPVRAVVFDIDGTLTITDEEQVHATLGQFVDLNYMPLMYDGANAFVTELAKQGYEIFYITARPYFLHDTSRHWLKVKGFPLGLLYTYRDSPIYGDAINSLIDKELARNYKRDNLLGHIFQGANFELAFGNATTDIDAYELANIAKDRTYIIGAHAGEKNTIPLRSYLDLFGYLVPERDDEMHVALIIVDGLRPDALKLYLDQYAPPDSALKRIFGNGSATLKSATTGPSVTFAGHASIVTGTYPNRHGVCGNGFMDRQTGGTYDFVSTAYSVDDVLNTYTGPGLGNQALSTKTIYEHLHNTGKYGVCSGHMYFRGSEYVYPSLTQLIQYVTNARSYDESLMDNLIDRLDQGVDIPNLMTIYMPGLDHEVHGTGGVGSELLSPNDDTNSQVEYLRDVTDRLVGKLEMKLAALDLLYKTVFVICSDHGHANVVDDEDYAVTVDPLGLDNEVENILENLPSPYTDVWDKPLGLEGDFDSHAGLNGAFMQIALRNRATNDWKDEPRWEDDVLPVIASIQKHRVDGELNLNGTDMVEEVLVRQGKNQPYQVLRPTKVRVTFQSILIIDDNDTGANDPGECFFDLKISGAVLKRIGQFDVNDNDVLNIDESFIVDVMPGMDFRVQCDGEDDDVLWWDSLGTFDVGFTDRTAIVGQTVTLPSDTGDFELTIKVEIVADPAYAHPAAPNWGHLCPLSVMQPAYVNGPWRITMLTHPDRSGDIIVLSKWRDGFYFGGTNASNHGSLYPEDTYQAFAIGGQPLTAGANFASASVVDIAPTIARLLGVELQNVDGIPRVTKQMVPTLR